MTTPLTTEQQPLKMPTAFDGWADPVDYSASRVLVPLSAGINSAAVLCALGELHPAEKMPLELHLYYAHLKQHSPDSFRFTADLVRYARRKFPVVKVRITRASVNRYFIEQGMIPHPTISPCSRELKIEPMQRYDVENEIDVVLIGYVRHEIKRYEKAVKATKIIGRTKDCYPILSWTDEDCVDFVKQTIGWYPAIYDIKWTEKDLAEGRLSPKRRFEIGRRVFAHNNCLPCKNMTTRQLQMVAYHFPEYAAEAQATADQIPGAYWGRDDVPSVMVCDACDRM